MLDEKEVIMVLDWLNAELRTTKRALWLARAERANDNANWYDLNLDKLYKNWQWVERKCREKAEEFK